MYKNSEGYSCPTEGAAISNLMREYRREQKRKYADKNRKKVYVASRYAGDVKVNAEAAANYCRHVIRKGYMPIAAHLMYPVILDDNDPAQRELGMLFVFKDTDERWRRRWKTPKWQVLLWIAFFIGGVVLIFKYPDFWDSYDAFYLFIFLLGSNYCRNIARYLIVKRYDFDKYKSVVELLSEHPEAGKYIK